MTVPPFRHCERSEAIHLSAHQVKGLLRRSASSSHERGDMRDLLRSNPDVAFAHPGYACCIGGRGEARLR
jgi:hypothetical protein